MCGASAEIPPRGPGEAELGYWVGVPFWGRGIATEAGKELIRHAFRDLGLTRIYCGYFEGNEKSKSVQKKCGFKPHHVDVAVYIPQLEETRVEFINYLDKSEWDSL